MTHLREPFVCKLTNLESMPPTPLLLGFYILDVYSPSLTTRGWEPLYSKAYWNYSKPILNLLNLFTLSCSFLHMKTTINTLACSPTSWLTLVLLHMALHDMAYLLFLGVCEYKNFFMTVISVSACFTIPDQNKSWYVFKRLLKQQMLAWPQDSSWNFLFLQPVSSM